MALKFDTLFSTGSWPNSCSEIPVKLRVHFQGRIKPMLQEAMVGVLPNDVLARNTKATFDPYYIRLLEAWCRRFPGAFATGDPQFDGYLRIRIDEATRDCDLSRRYERWSEVASALGCHYAPNLVIQYWVPQ